jgi:hypothetical protein
VAGTEAATTHGGGVGAGSRRVEVMLSPTRGWVPAVVGRASGSNTGAALVVVNLGVRGEGAVMKLAEGTFHTRLRMTWGGGGSCGGDDGGDGNGGVGKNGGGGDDGGSEAGLGQPASWVPAVVGMFQTKLSWVERPG